MEALAQHRVELIDRIIALESIAPKKMRQADGGYVVWRCPVELIPEAPRL